MFWKLLVLFTLVPLVELALLIKLGGYIGIIPTIAIVAGTGVIGVSLARSQGLELISRVKNQVNSGRVPSDQLLEGVFILIGGAMLLTPGLITDTSGFLLILPFSRKWLRERVKVRIKSWLRKKGFDNLNYYYRDYRDYRDDDDY